MMVSDSNYYTLYLGLLVQLLWFDIYLPTLPLL